MRTAREEWKANWPLVLATTAGFSLHPVATYATGVFMEPLAAEFGWSRAQISVGLTITAMILVPLSPFIGALIDRWGSRRLALPGTIATALSIASFGLADGSATQWIALWTIFGVVTMAVKPTVWTAAVSRVFFAGRGVALAFTLSGVAIAQILVPSLSYWLIENYGWRHAYMILGLGWGAVCLVPIVLFLFDKHVDASFGHSPQDGGSTAALASAGLSVAEAARSIVLWRIGLASFLTMLFGIAVVVHQVPILTETGISRENAALLAGLAGFAGITGKLVTGWLMDRRGANMIGALTLAVAAVGFFLLLGIFEHLAFKVVAMLIIGYSTGAKLQISAYLTGRYGGMRNFGKIFGTITSMIALGSGFGPVLAGAVYDVTGSYFPLIAIGIVGSILSGLLIYGLGPYPDWTETSGRSSTPGIRA